MVGPSSCWAPPTVPSLLQVEAHKGVAPRIWRVAGYPEGFWPDPLIRPKALGGRDPVIFADDPQELHAIQEDDDLLGRDGRMGESA